MEAALAQLRLPSEDQPSVPEQHITAVPPTAADTPVPAPASVATIEGVLASSAEPGDSEQQSGSRERPPGLDKDVPDPGASNKLQPSDPPPVDSPSENAPLTAAEMPADALNSRNPSVLAARDAEKPSIAPPKLAASGGGVNSSRYSTIAGSCNALH